MKSMRQYKQCEIVFLVDFSVFQKVEQLKSAPFILPFFWTPPPAPYWLSHRCSCLFLCAQTFRRDGNDLFINHKIGLVEALCGFQFMLKHLDDRQIVVKHPAGKVIEPGRVSPPPLLCTKVVRRNKGS